MTYSLPDIARQLHGKLLVSCQAPEGSPLCAPSVMATFARSVIDAGAAGIRANGAADVAAIRQAVKTPVIGIAKRVHDDGVVLITPTFEAARELVEAGANLIALDCTRRGQRFGAFDRVRRIKSELGVPVLADVATVEEARQAVDAGADLILTTLRGYSSETEHILDFDLEFVRELVRELDVPILAEGRIATPEQAGAAIGAGAFAVIVGTAITRPDELTRKFVAAVDRASSRSAGSCAIGIDLGGTNTKFAIVKRDGSLNCPSSWKTPAAGGRDALMAHLKQIAAHCGELAVGLGLSPSAIGIATAGWVDPRKGAVVHATGNLQGWTGTGIRTELEGATRLPVTVENDANALAVGERHFGLAKNVADFICITLGTGVGGGCYVGGHLSRGAHYLANAIGHIQIQPGGLPCTCGQRGCLEAYANAAALVRYAGARFETAEDVIAASNSGGQLARDALRQYAHHLALGCASLVYLFDPELIVLSGGMAQNNPALIPDLAGELATLVFGWEQRHLRVERSPLGCHGAVLGAAALALEEGPGTDRGLVA